MTRASGLDAGTAVVWHARCRRADPGAQRRAHRAVVRQILATVTGIPEPDLPIVVAPGGKPGFADDAPDHVRSVHFNASHSGEHLVVACSTSGPVGVDVEQARALDAAAVAGYALAPRERARLSTLPDAELPRVLLRVWTRKEALLKADGVGLARAASSLEVDFDRPPAARALQHSAGWPWQLYDVSPEEDLTVALVTTGPVRVVHRTWGEIASADTASAELAAGAPSAGSTSAGSAPARVS